MYYLPEIPSLGSLSVIEVYEFYDIPLLFSCKNLTGHIFFALSINIDDLFHECLYVPVSEARFQSLCSGEIELRDVYLNAEDNFVYQVRCYYNNTNKDTIDLIQCSDLIDEWLPLKGEKLLLYDNEKNPEKIIPEAKNTQRDKLNLSFDFGLGAEAPAGKIGAILSSLQEVINALGQWCNGTISSRGSINSRIIKETQLNVVKTFSGSFGVQLDADATPDMFNTHLISDSLIEFLSLLEAKDNDDLLSIKLHNLKGRVVSKYKLFLENLYSSLTGINCHFESIKADVPKNTSLSLLEIKKVLTIINEIATEVLDEYQTPCILIGLNIRTKRYEIQSLEDDAKKFSGVIMDKALLGVSHPTINEKYIAYLQKKVEFVKVSGDEKVEWALIKLSEFKK